MADISAEITAFRNAVYGEDVRDAMVSLANKVNNESTSAASTVSSFSSTLSLLNQTQLDIDSYLAKNIDFVSNWKICNILADGHNEPYISSNNKRIGSTEMFFLPANTEIYLTDYSDARFLVFASRHNENYWYTYNWQTSGKFLISFDSDVKLLIRHSTEVVLNNIHDLLDLLKIDIPDFLKNNAYINLNKQLSTQDSWVYGFYNVVNWSYDSSYNFVSTNYMIASQNIIEAKYDVRVSVNDPYKIHMWLYDENDSVFERTASSNSLLILAGWRFRLFMSAKENGTYIPSTLDKIYLLNIQPVNTWELAEILMKNQAVKLNDLSDFCSFEQGNVIGSDGYAVEQSTTYRLRSHGTFTYSGDVSFVQTADDTNINLYIFGLDSTNKIISNSGWISTFPYNYTFVSNLYYRFLLRMGSTNYVHPSSLLDKIKFILPENNEIIQVVNTSNDINYLNKDSNSILVQTKRRINDGPGNFSSKTPILSLLHFSDIHGDGVNLNRIIQYKNAHSNYIDDVLCTGDVVSNFFTDGIDFWNAIDGSEDIMISIGNHDVIQDSSTYVEYTVPQQDVYDLFLADNIGSWGVVYQQGKMYWYKDYPTNKIRLISIDCMLSESSDVSAQNTWLETTLSGAKTNGYSVVCAMHWPHGNTKINSNFTAIDIGASRGVNVTTYLDTIDSFIENNGNFICWLVGHLHRDTILYDSLHPKQPYICVCCANPSTTYGDVERIRNTKSQDCFNIVSFDVDSTLIKVVRVGVDHDVYLRSRKSITIDYSTTPITIVSSE